MAPPRAGVTVEPVSDRAHAMAWFTAERQVLVSAVRQAADRGFDTHAWQIAWTLGTFFDYRGHLHDWVEVQQLALGAARHLADRTAEARVLRGLAYAAIRQRDYDAAHSYFSNALVLAEELGDDVGRAHVHLNLGQALEQQSRLPEALTHAEKALALGRAVGRVHLEATSLAAIGWLHGMLGEPAEGLVSCHQAATLLHRIGDRHGVASTWDSIGYLNSQLSRYPEAMSAYRRALAERRDLGDQRGIAVVLVHFGESQLAAGDPVAAREASPPRAEHVDRRPPTAGPRRRPGPCWPARSRTGGNQG